MVETVQSSCGGFVLSKAGLWKFLVLASGCATFALYADSRMYLNPAAKTYVLAAFIISWAVSLLLYFARVTGLWIHCSLFNPFDYFWSWISAANYVTSCVILACYFSNCDPGCNNRGFCACAKQLTSLFLGFLTAVFYVLEAQNLRLYAPVGTGYGTTWVGIWKMFILVVGGTAFGLLVETGYRCSYKHRCTEARTFVLAAWCTAWVGTCIMYLFHILNFSSKVTVKQRQNFGTVEFFWSSFSCLLFLIGASVLAGYLGCTNFNSYICRSRLAADICGFSSAILYLVDAYNLRSHRPNWHSAPPPNR